MIIIIRYRLWKVAQVPLNCWLKCSTDKQVKSWELIGNLNWLIALQERTRRGLVLLRCTNGELNLWFVRVQRINELYWMKDEIKAQKHTKPLLLNVVVAVQNTNDTYINLIQKLCRLLWASAHLSCLSESGLTSQFRYFLQVMGIMSLGWWENAPSRLLPARSKAWICDGISMGKLHIYDSIINAERDTQVMEQHMLPSKQYPQGHPCFFL